jgi:hypothetical protein
LLYSNNYGSTKFATAIHFHTSHTFAGKAGAYQSGEPMGLLALPAITQAYYYMATITTVQSLPLPFTSIPVKHLLARLELTRMEPLWDFTPSLACKHSSLLFYCSNYGSKKVYSTGLYSVEEQLDSNPQFHAQ